jgi:amphi-Trp domain-containing protein
MPEVVLFKSEDPKSRDEAAVFLRQLADKLESGDTITLRGGSGSVVLDIPERLVLEVKAEEESKPGFDAHKRSLEIELEWKLGEQKAVGVSLE